MLTLAHPNIIAIACPATPLAVSQIYILAWNMANWTKYWPDVTSGTPLTYVPPEVVAGIAGNAPLSIKETALTWYRLLAIRGDSGFEYATRKHVTITEVSLEPSPDDPQSLSAKMVCELEVAPGALRMGRLNIKTLIYSAEMCDKQGVLSHWSMYSLIDEYELPLQSPRNLAHEHRFTT